MLSEFSLRINNLITIVHCLLSFSFCCCQRTLQISSGHDIVKITESNRIGSDKLDAMCGTVERFIVSVFQFHPQSTQEISLSSDYLKITSSMVEIEADT